MLKMLPHAAPARQCWGDSTGARRFLSALGCGLGGVLLAAGVNAVAAICYGILAYVVYVGIYTPLKRLSPACTLLEWFPAHSRSPLAGAADVAPGVWAWVTFGLLYFWQYRTSWPRMVATRGLSRCRLSGFASERCGWREGGRSRGPRHSGDRGPFIRASMGWNSGVQLCGGRFDLRNTFRHFCIALPIETQRCERTKAVPQFADLSARHLRVDLAVSEAPVKPTKAQWRKTGFLYGNESS